MDLISEVISSSGEVELSELKSKINYLSLKSVSVKNDVIKSYENNYVHFVPSIPKSTLVDSANTLLNETKSLQEKLESQMKREINSLSTETTKILTELTDTHHKALFIKNTVAIDQYLKEAQSNLSLKNYYEAAGDLQKALSLLQTKVKFSEAFELYSSLEQCAHLLRSQLLDETLEKWNDVVTWNYPSGSKSKTASLIIFNDLVTVRRTFQTLDILKASFKEIDSFADVLYKDILKPIILQSCNVSVTPCGPAFVLNLEVKHKLNKSSFDEAFENICQVFKFLSKHLNISDSNQVHFLTIVGDIISKDVILLFISDQVSDKIPLKKSDLGKYEDVAKKLLLLETEFLNSGFLTEKSELIITYTENFEELFKNKQGELCLDLARKIIKKDLHDMISVGPMPFDPSSNEVDDTFFSSNKEEKYKFLFPKCQVSKSSEELYQLMRDCLLEATKSDRQLAISYIRTVQEILGLFISLTPAHHRALLDNIPQQSAVVYNSAMYLVANIVRMESEFRRKWPEDISQEDLTTFENMIPSLSSMASAELEAQISVQKSTLSSTLETSGLLELSELESFPKSIEKAIRQCVRQLLLLQTVWQHVLPTAKYCLIMGTLCDSFIEKLVSLILSASDMREDIANKLVDMFKFIEEKLPQVFPEEKEVARWVQQWGRLGELGRVLAGSLVDVGERWASGSGPLAHHFTADQVRSLVRALFQLSERRTNLIASIR